MENYFIIKLVDEDYYTNNDNYDDDYGIPVLIHKNNDTEIYLDPKDRDYNINNDLIIIEYKHKLRFVYVFKEFFFKLKTIKKKRKERYAIKKEIKIIEKFGRSLYKAYHEYIIKRKLESFDKGLYHRWGF